MGALVPPYNPSEKKSVLKKVYVILTFFSLFPFPVYARKSWSVRVKGFFFLRDSIFSWDVSFSKFPREEEGNSELFFSCLTMESLYSEEESLGAHVITTRGLEQKRIKKN